MIIQTGWHIAHIAFLSAWCSLAMAKIILKIAARLDFDLKKTVACFHYYFDLFIEIPLLIGILVTGIFLISSAKAHFDLFIKIGFSLISIFINFLCAMLVIKRWRIIRHHPNSEKEELLSRWIQRAGIAIPFTLIAFYIGAKRAGWF